MIEFENFLL